MHNQGKLLQIFEVIFNPPPFSIGTITPTIFRITWRLGDLCHHINLIAVANAKSFNQTSPKGAVWSGPIMFVTDHHGSGSVIIVLLIFVLLLANGRAKIMILDQAAPKGALWSWPIFLAI